MDFEIFILLVLMSTHLLAFWIGWTIRDINHRESERGNPKAAGRETKRHALY